MDEHSARSRKPALYSRREIVPFSAAKIDIVVTRRADRVRVHAAGKRAVFRQFVVPASIGTQRAREDSRRPGGHQVEHHRIRFKRVPIFLIEGCIQFIQIVTLLRHLRRGGLHREIDHAANHAERAQTNRDDP